MFIKSIIILNMKSLAALKDLTAKLKQQVKAQPVQQD